MSFSEVWDSLIPFWFAFYLIMSDDFWYDSFVCLFTYGIHICISPIRYLYVYLEKCLFLSPPHFLCSQWIFLDNALIWCIVWKYLTTFSRVSSYYGFVLLCSTLNFKFDVTFLSFLFVISPSMIFLFKIYCCQFPEEFCQFFLQSVLLILI